MNTAPIRLEHFTKVPVVSFLLIFRSTYLLKDALNGWKKIFVEGHCYFLQKQI